MRRFPFLLVTLAAASSLLPSAASGTPGPSILLRLDGQPQGMMQAAAAQPPTALVDYRAGDATILRKLGATTTSSSKYTPLLLKQQPGAVTPATARWIDEMLSGSTPQHAVEVLFLDASSKPAASLTEPGAYLAGVDLPKVPSALGDAPAALTLRVVALTSTQGGAESAVPAGVTASVPDVAAAQLTFDGIATFSGRMDAWSPAARAKSESTDRVVTRTLDATLAGGTGAFSVVLPTSQATVALASWAAAPQKKNGKIEYVAATGKVLFTVQLGGVSIVKLAGPTLNAGGSQVATTQVDFTASSVLVAAGP